MGIFSQKKQPAERPNVEIGDRYYAKSNGNPIWIVDKVTSVKSSTQPLVSLKREGYPDLVKIVSIGALMDGEDFLQVTVVS